MVSYDQIAFPELKQAIRLLNETGFVNPTLRHVGVKGAKLYDEFIFTVENLSQDQKQSLPDGVINFFNYAIDDADAEPEDPELNFEPEPKPEPDPEPENVQEPETETIPTPVTGRRRGVKKQEPVKPKPTAVKPDLDKKPVKKVGRLAKIVMSPKVANGKLTIEFKELNISETFALPPIDDKAALKPIRKEAMDFASTNGATKGQLCNISKTLNLAGYYAR